MKIKNWERFQHYRNRKPPWIRLYNDLLVDPEFFALSGDAFKHLVMLWLIASEDPDMEGKLPAVSVLAFRARITDQKMTKLISELSHWVEGDASDELSGCHQLAPESCSEQSRSEQIRSEGECALEGFDQFWSAYPKGKKKKKPDAMKAWKQTVKNRPEMAVLLSSLAAHSKSHDWTKEGGKYIPHPASWLRAHEWNDAAGSTSGPVTGQHGHTIGRPQPKEFEDTDSGERMTNEQREALFADLKEGGTG